MRCFSDTESTKFNKANCARDETSHEAVDIGLVRRGYSATGGAEAYLLRLASGLRSRGCAVTLYTTVDWPADRWTFGDLVRLDASPTTGVRARFCAGAQAGADRC